MKSPHLLQLEKDRPQQQRPSTAKNIFKKFKNLKKSLLLRPAWFCSLGYLVPVWGVCPVNRGPLWVSSLHEPQDWQEANLPTRVYAVFPADGSLSGKVRESLEDICLANPLAYFPRLYQPHLYE